jgi:hypothetical protein
MFMSFTALSKSAEAIGTMSEPAFGPSRTAAEPYSLSLEYTLGPIRTGLRKNLDSRKDESAQLSQRSASSSDFPPHFRQSTVGLPVFSDIDKLI